MNGIKREWVSDDGTSRLLQGNAYELLPQIDPASINCMITDPPYEITAKGGGICAPDKNNRRDLQATEGFTDCGFDYSVLDRFPNWMCFGTLRQVPKLIDRAGERRWMLVTWNKNNPCPLVNGNYLPDTEYIIHAWLYPQRPLYRSRASWLSAILFQRPKKSQLSIESTQIRCFQLSELATMEPCGAFSAVSRQRQVNGGKFTERPAILVTKLSCFARKRRYT